MSQIELVLCDVDNVLVLADCAITIKALEAADVRPERAELFFKNETYREFCRGRLGHMEAYRRMIRDHLDEGIAYQDLVAAHDAHITVVDPGVAAILSDLLHVRPVAFVTDTNLWQTARVRELVDLRQFTDLIIKSDDSDIQSLKTDPEAWNRILARLGIDPTHIVFIDDSPAKIAAARKAGLVHLIEFENAGQLHTELRQVRLL